MTPFQEALAMFRGQGHTNTQGMQIIAQFIACGGCVYAGPDCFAMARQVSRQWPKDVICDHLMENEDLTGELDCWHISYASGDLQALLEKLPHQLPWISYQRNGQGKLVIHNLKSFQRHGISLQNAKASEGS